MFFQKFIRSWGEATDKRNKWKCVVMSAIVDLFACFFVFFVFFLYCFGNIVIIVVNRSNTPQSHFSLILKVQLTLFFVIRYNGWMDLSWETLWPVSGNYLTPINIFLTKVEHTEKARLVLLKILEKQKTTVTVAIFSFSV